MTAEEKPHTFRKLGVSTIALVACLLAASCSNPDSSTEASSSGQNEFKELYEAAKSEGALELYSTITAPAPREEMVKEFEAAFPGIKVTHVGKPGQGILEQFLSEERAGLHNVDVLQYPGSGPFEYELQDENLLMAYTPTSADLYPEEAVVEGLGYPAYAYQVGAGYNPDLVTDEEIELLKTYEGWTDPVFKGRSNVIGPTGGTGSRSILQWATQDENMGWDWMQDLADQKPAVFNSITPAAERVVAGEYAVSFNQLQVTAGRNAEMGAPYRFVFPKEYVVTAPTLMGISADAPNPNAAKLFVEWTLSEEGQNAVLKATQGASLREGMTDIVPFEADWYEPAPADKLVYVDEVAVKSQMPAVTDKFMNQFGSLGND